MNELNTLRRLLPATFLPFLVAGCGAAPGEDVEALGTTQEALTCSAQLVPTLSGASGSVITSGNFSSTYPEWKAFDSSNTSMWISSLKTTPAILGYDFGAAKRVSRYAITYSNGSILTRAPKNWVFEGYNGSTWVVLDTRNNQTNWAGFERREYTVTSPGSYGKYRLRISDDNDARTGVEVISMGRLELFDCTSEGDPLWVRNVGASGAWTQGMDMVGDPASRTYLVGTTTGSLDGQPKRGVVDGFLRSTDWHGNTLFTHQFGSPNGASVAQAIARNINFENVWVAGYTDGTLFGEPAAGSRNLFVTKMRYTGVRQWTRVLGSPNGWTEGYGIAVDPIGNSFAVGAAWADLDGNVRKSSIDTFVTKYDTDGTKQWTRLLGTTAGRSWARTAAADASGNVYVAGRTEGAFPGGPTPSGEDAFLAKYNAAGTLAWVKQLRHAGCALELRGAVVAHTGRLYLSGTNGCTGGFVAEYDTNGNLLWESVVGGWGSKLYTDAWGYMANDDLYLAGGADTDLNVPNSPQTSFHGFVARLSPSGVKRSLQQLAPPTNGAMYLYGLTVDESGSPYVGGTLKGIYNGTPTIGTDDAFVLKLPKP
jgi:hypothetical protein